MANYRLRVTQTKNGWITRVLFMDNFSPEDVKYRGATAVDREILANKIKLVDHPHIRAGIIPLDLVDKQLIATLPSGQYMLTDALDLVKL